MRKYLIVILLFCTSTSFGQVYFDHGPKVGISSNLVSDGYAQAIYFPVFGYWGQAQFNQRLSLMGGAHFQRTGSRPAKNFTPYYWNSSGDEAFSGYTNKISVPLQLRVLKFGANKHKPAFHVGLTTNFLLGGQVDVLRAYLTQDSTKIEERYKGKTIVTDWDNHHKKVLYQLNFGVDINLTNNLYLNFDMHLGTSYTYVRLPFIIYRYHGILNNDFEFSLRYRLIKDIKTPS